MMLDATRDPIDCQLVLLPSPTNIHFLNPPPPVALLYLLKLTENVGIYECSRNRDITLLGTGGGEH
jgi:hypothetical protein